MALLDPAIETTTLTANGLRFRALTCGKGDRLALCLHGFPELGFSWRYQLPLLAELGYRAVAPDLRGYGGSDRPSGVEAYAIEELMADVRGLIQAAEPRETVLLAHDWGAVIAWYFAMRGLWKLDRLVICNVPHPAVMSREIRSGWRQRLRSWYVLFFQIPWLPEALMRAGNARAIAGAFADMAVDKHRFPDEVLDVYRQNALQPGALTAMIHYYRALVRGGGARRQESLGFPVIDVPTLMIWGEQDRALGKQTTYGTHEWVSDLTVRYLPHASHWVQQDAPETTNAILRAWLSGEPVPRCNADGSLVAA